MAGGIPPLNKMRSSIGIALLQACILTFMVGQTSSPRNFLQGFFTQDGKIELNRGFWNRKYFVFPIIISRQFPWKYWYVFGLCIDTVLLAFILSVIDVSVNRRSPNTHTCMTKVKQIYIRVWLRKSRCTYVYDWRKADIHTYMTEEKQIYKLLLYAK